MATINEFIKDIASWIDQTEDFEGEVDLDDGNASCLTVKFSLQSAEIINRKRWSHGEWREVDRLDVNEGLLLKIFSLLLSEKEERYSRELKERRRIEEQQRCMEFENKTINWAGSMAGY